jgi:hydrogenase maturation protein HypF
MEELYIRIRYEIEGVVQGVGFRPAIHRIATGFGLVGWVRNDNDRVTLQLEGAPEIIGQFITALPERLPTLARIKLISIVGKTVLEDPPTGVFEIVESSDDESGDSIFVIPSDAAMCAECAKEITNPEDRRYGYPFTTCVDCGPRHTVVTGTPYDRERTTLAAFPLCPECEKEYESHSDRRHHAESVACPECGPSLTMLDAQGAPLPFEGRKILEKARAEIAAGKILAVRGIGGFHLAADAFNRKTIANLRKRKKRPDKPFAVMFRDLETVFEFCALDPEIVKLLSSPAAPIVVAPLGKPRKNDPSPAFDMISPDTRTVGAMIPYSPLHKLLFEPLEGDPTPPFEALIMTSGNRGGEPVAIANDEALEKLAGIADIFITHDREINIRDDDSIAVPRAKNAQIWRRARGYAPAPVENRSFAASAPPVARSILAMGAGLKNTPYPAGDASSPPPISETWTPPRPSRP